VNSTIVPIVIEHQVWHIFLALSIQGIAYCAQFNVLPLYAELRQPTIKRMRFVIYSFGFACFFLYATVALFGYLLFGGASSGNILDNFGNDDIVISIGRVALAATILLKLPLCSLPFRIVLNDMLFRGKRTIPRWLVFFENAALLVTCGTLAVLLKNLNTALGILGGTTGVVISYILPGSIYLKAASSTTGQHLLAIGMIIFGVVVGVLSIVSNVLVIV